MRGARERRFRRLRVAELRIDEDVVFDFVPERRRAGPHRVFRMQHEWQFLVAHLHRFGGIRRLRLGFRHHHGDRLADMARSVRGQQQMRADENRAAARRGELHVEFGLRHRIVRNGLEIVGYAIGAGEHPKHARHRVGPRRIDGDDARMRIGRAHHHRISLPVEREVVGKAALAGDEPRVLLARQRLADEAVSGFFRSCFIVHRVSGDGIGWQLTAPRAASQDLPYQVLP